MMKNQRSIKLILSLFLFNQSLLAEEALHVWTKIGPQGGGINSFRVGPNHPDTLYTSISYSPEKQYLKSSNGGVSWVAIPFGKFPIFDLSIDSADPNTLFAISQDGEYQTALLKSKDGGVHWYQIAKNLGSIDIDSFIILNTPFDNTLQAWLRVKNSHDLGIAVSNDGGEQWTLTDKRVSNAHDILLARDYGNPDILYASHLFNIHAHRTWNCSNPLEGGQAVLHRRQA